MNQIKKSKIAFIQAGWHKDIVQQSFHGFVDEMSNHNFSPKQIDLFEVPGSLEIPLRAQLLAKSGDYAAIVGAGLVVDGGIYRHDFVANAVLNGIMRVQLDSEIPVLSIVLTPHQFQETAEHIGFFREHLYKKGKEAALACSQLLSVRAEAA